jgi:AraC family L-rhamnose operon transcriptional activator RhaR/AraC family L-rhamnose operon regulatory protein RhaS
MVSKNNERCIEKEVSHLTLKMYAGDFPAMAIKCIHQTDPEATNFDNGRTYTHDHDYYEFVVVVEGSGLHYRSGLPEEKIHPGMVLLIYPGEAHYYIYTEKLVLQTFMASEQLIISLENELKQMPGYDELFCQSRNLTLTAAAPAIAELDIMLNTIASEVRNPRPGSTLMINSKIIEALVVILRNTSPELRNTPARSIAPAVSYMWRHYCDNLKNSRLARLVNLSESSFYRKFCREFACSPQQYLLKLRLRKAAEFLLRSDMTVNEVASACGFRDQLYFSRQFRNHFGLSPRAYRKTDHGAWQKVSGLTSITCDTDIENKY